MALIAKDSGKDFKPAPAGTHLAICCQVVDLGTQPNRFSDKEQRKVLIGWELPDEPNEEGKPFMVWNRYTLSLNSKANLCKHLESWRGRPFTEAELAGFDLKQVLGVPCMLSVIHEKGDDGKVWANISAIMSPPKGTKIPELTHPKVWFDIGEWDQATFDTFGENLKKTIEQSAERTKGREGTKKQERTAPAAADVPWTAGPMDDSDIPFSPMPAYGL